MQLLPLQPTPLTNQETRCFGHLLYALYSKKYRVASFADLACLVRLADFYRALPVVSSSFDAVLLASFNLYGKIADHPLQALSLSYRVKSAILFREALVHVVGQWHFAFSNADQQSLEEPIRGVTIQHHLALREKVIQAWFRLLNICLKSSSSANQSSFIQAIIHSRIKKHVQPWSLSVPPESEAEFYRSVYQENYEPSPQECNDFQLYWFKKYSVREVTEKIKRDAEAVVQGILGPLMDNYMFSRMTASSVIFCVPK